MEALAQVMLAFEALGDNCEFGLVQRAADIKPLGLLRFAGFYIPVEQRLARLKAALDARFEGLGNPDTVRVVTAGREGRPEYLIEEDAWNMMYHTALHEGDIEPQALQLQEASKLRFLRRKLLTDLERGEKILVWKSNLPVDDEAISGLMQCLLGFGRNTLLWVVEADPDHPPGMVETRSDTLLKGYVERFAPYDRATDVSPRPWFRVCEEAFRLTRAMA